MLPDHDVLTKQRKSQLLLELTASFAVGIQHTIVTDDVTSCMTSKLTETVLVSCLSLFLS